MFEPGLNMNAIDPEIDIAFGREVAFDRKPQTMRTTTVRAFAVLKNTSSKLSANFRYAFVLIVET